MATLFAPGEPSTQSHWMSFFSHKLNRALLLIFIACVIAISLVDVRGNHHKAVNAAQSMQQDPAKYAVIKENFADPCLGVDDDGTYYAFATGNATIGINVQVASAPSTNLSDWTLHKGQDALPVLGSWALQPNKIAQVWAPEVVQRVRLSLLACPVLYIDVHLPRELIPMTPLFTLI